MSCAQVADTVRMAVDAAADRLAAAGVPSARADAEWLLAALRGVGRAALALSYGDRIGPELRERYETAVRRRAAREPLQYIVGWEEFRGRRFAVTPAVMVPRPETEVLVEWALALLSTRPVDRRRLVLDVGTGSGCIACSLVDAASGVHVVALDVSPEAAAVAAANVHRLGLDRRVAVVASDVFEALGPVRFDLIVANPPYLPAGVLSALMPEVGAHEPRLALDGGGDGLCVIRRIVAEAPARLEPGGLLVMETAGGEQASEVRRLFHQAGFVDVAGRADLVGVERFVAGRLREVA